MGIILERIGRVDEALDYEYKGLAIQQSLLKADENAVENRRLVMNTHLMIARGLTDNGEFKAAMQETRKSQEVAQDLNRIDPGNTVYQRDLWIADMRMGGLMLKLGNPSGALPQYRNGLASIARLSAADPGDKGHRRGLAVTYLALADALAELKLGEAVENYEKAIAISQALLAGDPNKPETQDDLANMKTHLATWKAGSGSFAQAEELFSKARVLLEAAVRRDPGNTRTQGDLAEMYARIGHLQATLAVRQTTPAARLARWRNARDFYAKGLDVWVGLRNQNLLWRVDAEKPGQAMRAVAACDAAIAKF
jgi:tetratricopeptide (TPR) repeat protein